MKFLTSLEISTFLLPENQRVYFKSPLGKLYKTEQQVTSILEKIFNDPTIPKIVSVGDFTTNTLVKLGFLPNIAIIDGLIERKKVPPPNFSHFQEIQVVNPPATISKNAWIKIRDVIKKAENKIIIKITGEEDLLVLPVVLEVPPNSKVLYGQPDEGLVVVDVTKETKLKVKELFQRMVKVNED